MILSWVSSIKEKFDNQILAAKQYLICKTKEVFMPKYTGSLSSAIITWRDTLSKKTLHHMFEDIMVRRLVEYIRVMKDKTIIIVLKGGLQIEEKLEQI